MSCSVPDDRGFTFVELMIVMLVLAVLASIAIPSFIDYRERGWSAAARSDVRNGVMAQRLHRETNDAFSANEAGLSSHGFRRSQDIDFWFDSSSTATRFELHAQHCSGGHQFRYVSDGAAAIERLARAARTC